MLAFAHPVFAGKLAIVIDDFGYRPHTENQFWRCRQTSPSPYCPTRRTRAKWQLKRTIAGMRC
ncbi:hypothetical protein IU399_11405 [Salmonella enterica subsp. enterica serovar Worthington]|nr:hypothetical protein [Salmonella enterica subsp. enterica serovar Worthington]